MEGTINFDEMSVPVEVYVSDSISTGNILPIAPIIGEKVQLIGESIIGREGSYGVNTISPKSPITLFTIFNDPESEAYDDLVSSLFMNRIDVLDRSSLSINLPAVQLNMIKKARVNLSRESFPLDTLNYHISYPSLYQRMALNMEDDNRGRSAVFR